MQAKTPRELGETERNQRPGVKKIRLPVGTIVTNTYFLG